MDLFLIRHAQSENNARPLAQRVEDPGLTPLGQLQAAQLAQRLASLPVQRVITSPFLRALQTAEYVQQATGLRPEVRIALHEKGGCVAGSGHGSFVGRPGMTRQQIVDRFPKYHVAADIDGQGWWRSQPFESPEQARARAQQLLRDTCREFGPSTAPVAYIMHGDFLLLLLSCFHPSSLNLAWNASLTRLSVDVDRVRLEQYSCVQHLPNYLVTW